MAYMTNVRHACNAPRAGMANDCLGRSQGSLCPGGMARERARVRLLLLAACEAGRISLINRRYVSSPLPQKKYCSNVFWPIPRVTLGSRSIAESEGKGFALRKSKVSLNPFYRMLALPRFEVHWLRMRRRTSTPTSMGLSLPEESAGGFGGLLQAPLFRL